jgi:hypothetical protein
LENNKIVDGFWTVDSHRPVDLSEQFEWTPEKNPWTYGEGGESQGAVGYGLMTTGRGARLLYPQAGHYGDMRVVVTLDPHKTAGQGFGSATGQYMDFYIKFDPYTLTGYGLRVERTPAYGNAVRYTLYSYQNGIGTPISEYVDSSSFLTGNTISLEVKGNILTAHAETKSPQQASQKEAGLAHTVDLKAEIEPNRYGGSGVQHTGTVSSGNRTMLHSILISAEKKDSVTRAEFIQLLVDGLGLQADVQNNFADVREEDSFYREVGIAKKLGISDGAWDGSFRPRSELSRQDMLTLAARTLVQAGLVSDKEDLSLLDRYADHEDIAAYAKGPIAILEGKGLLDSQGDRSINPTGTVSRAEASVKAEKLSALRK